jgi:hypothetical protein
MRWLALWLPDAASSTHWEATLYRDMAGAAWAAGEPEVALDFAERACFLAEWLGDESLYGYCRDGKAELLLKAGQSTRALDYLSPPGPNDVPYDRIQKILRWARLLWDHGDRTAADWLSEAYELIERFNYTQFRVSADALAQEFRAGC